MNIKFMTEHTVDGQNHQLVAIGNITQQVNNGITIG
jgi:hypothetical protein